MNTPEYEDGYDDVVDAPAEDQVAAARPERRAKSLLTPAVVVIVLLVGAVGFQLYRSYQMNATVQAQEKQLALISQRLNESDGRYAELAGQFRVVTERLGFTERELGRARQMAARIKEEQQQRVQEITQQLEQKAAAAEVAAQQQETVNKLGALATDVSSTREQVTSAGKEIAETQRALSELQLKVSEYGTLIARNQEELSLLRRRGERDYFEFDIRKDEDRVVSDLRLKLKKADVKKQRCDIEFVADDRKREKGKVNLNEPVQVFVGGLKTPYEIVINQVMKDRVTGYVSAPKDRAQAAGRPLN